MKKVRKQCKRALSMILALTMVVGMLSGCGLGEKPTSDPVPDTVMAVEEVNEVTLSSQGEENFLLTAGEKPELEFDTMNGKVTNITVTPADKTLEAYQYYTVTVTLTAKNGESFAKSVTITLDGVKLTVKEQSEDRLVVEYTTLALPDTITTDEMAKVSTYGEAASEKALGTAKIQALLDADLTVYSEDGKTSYIVKKGYVPLFMVPSFVANGEPEQIRDGESVQIISEHGEEDFSGAYGAWYKIAYHGKVGYLPITFVKDTKLQTNAAATPAPAATPKKTAQTRPAAKPAASQTAQQTAATENNDSGSSGSGSSGTNNGSSSDNGSGSNVTKTVYYQVDFALGGGVNSSDAILPSALMVEKNSALDINQLATPSVPGYLFEAWYYDSALTRQVQTGDRINANTTLYAKVTEITGAEVAQGQDNYISKTDVNADNFTITVLKPAGGNSTEKSADVVELHDLADQNTSLELQISKPEDLTVGGKDYEKYTISSDELEAGNTYQLQLLDGGYVFYDDNQIQPAVVRLYNFTTAMQAKENLDLNSGLVYLPKSEVTYTEGSDYLSGLFNVSVKDDMTQLNTVEGKGSFTYNGDQTIEVGTTVVIYDGQKAPKLGEDVKAAAQYDGNAAYVTISKKDGNTYYYGVAEAEDVLFTPDVLPVNVKDDKDNSDTTVTIDTAKLVFSGSEYQDMGLGADTTVDIGDYLAFYEGSMDTATKPTYGRITAIAVSGKDTILTYEGVSEETVLDSMTVYSTEEMDIKLDEATAQSIEREIEQEAIASGFAEEAANYLATVALATDQIQSLAEERGLQDLTLTREDGSALTQSDLQLMASNSVSVEGLSVHANISRSLKHLTNSYTKNGANAQLEVSFNVKIGSGKNQLTIKVAATFEQEILLNLNIKGKAVWGKKWIFRYIKDYSITTNLDAGSYTGVGITATVVAEKDEDNFDWSSVAGNTLGEQIKNLMNAQDKFFNQDITGTGGGLADKYADMLENNPDWIDLVNVNIFSNEARILAGIIVVGVQGDFVVSAKVNIMLGMSFEYSVSKRYTFTLNVFSKSSSSNCVDLTKSNYRFDMYVMGTLGLRAGIRLTVYAGLFSKKVASIGITAEAGAYVQMWGYFYYSTSWEAGSSKKSSASGAMLLEVGAYLEIRFLASAFNGRFKYAPVLYDKYWPLWNMGSVENVYGFNYETIEGEKDDKDINMGANTSVALPVDRLNMSYMNLRNGNTTDKTYAYGDFNITTTGNFKYENGVISVNIPDGSNEEKGTVTLTWKGAPLSFTSKPLSYTLDITWSDPSRVQSVSYDLNGGTAYENGETLPDGISGETVITGAKLTEPSVELKKEFYVFGGWYKDAACTIPWNFDKDKVTENLVLHAKWNPEPYEITYELDGGTNSEANPATYTAEDTVKLADPVKAGYVFQGWYTTADGTGTKVTEIAAGNRGAKIFYALWTPMEQTYEIHHMLQTVDGTGYEDAETVKATALTGTNIKAGAEQSKVYTGFTFDSTKTEDSEGVIPGEGTLVLKLYYSRNTYDVTFSGTNSADQTVKVPYQGKVNEPETPVKAGYTFTGWYVTAEPSRLWNFETDVVTGTTELRAGWSANTYNVTFDLQGGAGGDGNVQATYDGAMPAITVPAWAGYQFAGYYDQAEGGTKYYNADGSSAINWNKAGDTTLYAQWTANSYQVIFNANGGSGSMDAEEFAYGEEKPLSTNSFTKTGYAFVGWTTGEIAGDVIYTDGASVSNLTTEQGGIVNLYAVWKPITYMVVYNGNGADGSMEDQQMTYDMEAALSPIGYTKTGYHFLGWAKTSTAQTGELDNLEHVMNLAENEGSKVTLYAVWGANTYTVAFHANGGTGSPMAEQSFTYDEAAKALSGNRYTRTGYTFKGWALTDTATEAEHADQAKVRNLVVTQDGVLDLYAVWTAQSYTVSFDANGGSMMTDSTSKEVTYGSTYGTLPPASRTGYDFAGWYTEKEAGTAIIADSTVSITADTALYARWTAKQFTVSFDTNKGAGSSTPTAVNSINVTFDHSYGDLPVTGRTGYTFNGWYTASSGGSEVTANTKVTLTEDQTLYAQWTANTYTVTFKANGGSFADSATEKSVTQTYDSNYKLPSETPTRAGYTFAGWYTGADGVTKVQNTDNVTRAENHELYAVWTAQSYTVSFDANGGSMMTDSTSKEVTYGSTYGTLPPASRTGYDFAGWYTEKEAGTAIIADSTVSITADTALYARWTAKQFTVSFDTNKGAGSSTPTAVSSINVNYDHSYGGLPVTKRTGYTFNGWYTASSGGSEVTANTKVTLTGDQTLYAQWTANTYEVTFNANGGSFAGSTTEKSVTQTYDGKYKLPSETPTRSGYTFRGWYTSSTAGSQITAATKMTTAGEQALYAHWEQVAANNISVNVGGVTLSYSGTPVYAKTDTNGKVRLGGNAANYNIKLENGVLTLNNATIKYAPVSDYHNGAVSADGTLTIELAAGTVNTITNTSSNSGISAWNCGIYVNKGPLTITGSGSLTATGGGGQSSHGISVDYGTLIVDGAAVTANGGNAAGSSGIYTGKNMEMKNGANVTAVGGTTSGGASRGIECSGSITITNSSGSASGKSVAMTKSPTMNGAVITSGSYNTTSVKWAASN